MGMDGSSFVYGTPGVEESVAAVCGTGYGVNGGAAHDSAVAWAWRLGRTFRPGQPIGIEHVALEGRDVLVVHVSDGQDKPYRANGRVYVRIDTAVHEATREEVSRLMVESGRVQYERLPVPEAEQGELNDALVREYFSEVRGLPYPGDAVERARLLVNLGFATQHAGRVVPTVAGLLLFGARPQDQLPAATLKCAFFYGQHQPSYANRRVLT
jgi:ATP-dependent DNA helicase RecG